MDGRKELLGYMGTATGTIVVLFALQLMYESHLDISHHARWKNAPQNAELKAVRDQEAQALAGIGKAKEALATRGRSGVPQVAPRPSEDLGAMAGWIHLPGFKPYEPRTPAQPEEAELVAPDGGVADAEVPVEGEADSAEGATAPAEAAPAAPAPTQPAPAAAAATHQAPAPSAPAAGH
ncbi:MAG: hypothetical protein OEZ06_18805 [Myxococcales bacterium]|nr:hypothetical protein [Myxococcales bacterium]